MTNVKTTLNIDEEKWTNFKRATSSLYGGEKTLSEVAEEAIESYDGVTAIRKFAEKRGYKLDPYPSLREIEDRRPTMPDSSVGILREMKNGRQNRVSGHEQPR